MYVIEQEIFAQPQALAQTRDYMLAHRDEILDFMKGSKKVVLIGCGSSYMISVGAAAVFNARTDVKAVALAGGELMLAPDKYISSLRNSTVIVISRSGETSEVVYALRKLRALTTFRTLLLTAKSECTLKDMVELTLTLPWSFDESVCQTRTIVNFYAAVLWIYGFYVDDAGLLASIGRAVSGQQAHLEQNRAVCRSVGDIAWDNVTVLADSELCGVAQEGALAFTEICMLPGEHFRVLDYRHGPIVVAGKRKLVIAVLRPEEEEYQRKMVADIKKRGATVIALSAWKAPVADADVTIAIHGLDDFAAWGIPFIAICQMIAYYKALAVGHNPDEPDGLNPYISL